MAFCNETLFCDRYFYCDTAIRRCMSCFHFCDVKKEMQLSCLQKCPEYYYRMHPVTKPPSPVSNVLTKHETDLPLVADSGNSNIYYILIASAVAIILVLLIAIIFLMRKKRILCCNKQLKLQDEKKSFTLSGNENHNCSSFNEVEVPTFSVPPEDKLMTEIDHADGNISGSSDAAGIESAEEQPLNDKYLAKTSTNTSDKSKSSQPYYENDLEDKELKKVSKGQSMEAGNKQSEFFDMDNNNLEQGKNRNCQFESTENTECTSAVDTPMFDINVRYSAVPKEIKAEPVGRVSSQDIALSNVVQNDLHDGLKETLESIHVRKYEEDGEDDTSLKQVLTHEPDVAPNNESIQDLRQTDAVPLLKPKPHPNRQIYDLLKGVDWIKGYYSEGKSIEVFANLNEIAADVALKELAVRTKQDPSKFHVTHESMQF